MPSTFLTCRLCSFCQAHLPACHLDAALWCTMCQHLQEVQARCAAHPCASVPPADCAMVTPLVALLDAESETYSSCLSPAFLAHSYTLAVRPDQI